MPPIKPVLRQARILLIGEAPGEQEALVGTPFIGPSGTELTRMLQDAGISRGEVSLSNVFLDRPPMNDLEAWTVGKIEADKLWRERHGRAYPVKAIKPARYLHPDHLPALDRIKEEIAQAKPNIVVALGGTACWALLGTTGISKLRGTVAESTLVPGLKVLPTYHPSAVLRQWKHRPIVVADLKKAKEESLFPEIRRPFRAIHIPETISDIQRYRTEYLDSAKEISYDIETARGQITCIGFAPNEQSALVIPLVCKAAPDYSYWSQEEEVQAWQEIKIILSLPQAKVTQNGMYDMYWLLVQWGIAPVNSREDTMFMHHALFPEMEKSLGFMGSVYTKEVAWKQMRKGAEEKKDA